MPELDLSLKSERDDKMKKTTIYILVLVVVVLPLLIIVRCFKTSNKSDTIFVTGYDLENYFYLEVENDRKSATGCCYEFETKNSKSELFEMLSTYSVYEERKNALSVIYKNEVFTLKELAEDRYILYGEYIIFEDEEATYYMPFPTKYMTDEVDGIPRMALGTFKVENLRYADLEKFYSVYSKIELNGNKVQNGNCVLEFETTDQGAVTFVKSKKIQE